MAAEVLRTRQHVMMRLARPQRAVYEYEMSQVQWPSCWMRCVYARDVSIIFLLLPQPAVSHPTLC